MSVFHRLAVCEIGYARISQGRCRLLQASVLSLRADKVGATLALDCARVLRKLPSKAAYILKACGTRTPEMLLELCRCYITLRAIKKLCRTGSKLLRSPNSSSEAALLRKGLLKSNMQSVDVVLFGTELAKATEQAFSEEMQLILAKKIGRAKLYLNRSEV